MIRITPIDPSSSEYAELMDCRGPLMEEWLAAWNGLGPNERDLCTHPVWICGFLSSIEQLPQISRKEISTQLFTVKHNSSLVTCIPLMHVPFSSKIPGLYYAKSPKMIAGSSLAIPKELAGDIVRVLFTKAPWNGHAPLSIIFDKVDNTNMFLHGDMSCITTPSQKRIVLNMEQGYEQVYMNLRRKTRKELNRAARKLESQGIVSISHTSEKEEILSAFERYVELEGAGWKHESQYAMKNNQFNRHFYRFLIEHMSELNAAVVSELLFNDTLIASHIAVVIERTLYSLKITYNEDFAEYSPGNLIIARVLADYMKQHSLTEYNCVSDSQWFQKTWRAESRPTVKCLLFANSPSGVIMRNLYRLYGTIRSLGTRQGGS